MLKIKDLSKSFFTGRQKRTVLKNISLEIPPGTVYGIVGPNGSGKTTLLKIIAGIILPDSGQIFIKNQPANLMQLKKSVGAVFGSETGFYPALTGWQNWDFFSSLAPDTIWLKKYVEELEISQFMEQPFSTFSSGTKQKLAFLRALFFRPDIILIDELENIDRDGRKIVFEIIKDYVQKDHIALFVSQHPEIFAEGIKILKISSGRFQ